jgi:hypothetical protein
VAALTEWLRGKPDAGHISTLELYRILGGQGIRDRRRRREAIDWLIDQRILTAAVGGYSVHREAL